MDIPVGTPSARSAARARPLGVTTLVLLAACAMPGGLGGAPLAAPRPVTPEGSRVERARLTVDSAGNAFLAMVRSGRVRVLTLGSAFTAETVLSEINIPQEDPAIEVGPREVAYVAFAQEDNELGSRGFEILLSGNPGGAFGLPQNVARNRIEDRRPCLALDAGGLPRLAWVQEPGNVVFHDPRRGQAQPVTSGDHPALAVDRGGFAHLACSLGERILVLDQGPQGFGPAQEVDRAAAGESPAPSIAVDGRGRLILLYVASGELRLSVRDEGGSFQAPRTIDRGLEAAGAELEAHLGENGRITAAYLRAGDIFLVGGEPDGPLAPERIVESAEAETSPSAREDRRGNVHLSFVRGGRLYYSNSAEAPSAAFSAEPGDGELPLDVRFQDHSTGEVRVWRWSFGDGATSSAQSPAHIYSQTGIYTVALEVFGPGGVSRVEQAGLIIVRDPSNTMRVAEVAALPAQRGVGVPVIGFHREPVQGFQVAGRFDPGVLTLRELSLDSTVTAGYEPEFFAPAIANGEGYFTAGVILDYNTPFDGRKIAAGKDQRLLYLLFDVSPLAPPGDSAVVLGSGIGESKLACMYAVDGLSRLPVLAPGRVRVLSPTSPPPLPFVRGDVNSDGEVNLSDAVGMLGFLFRGDPLSVCADSFDADDSGEIDISDVVYLLSYLFLSGPPVALPYPGPGLDTTDDALPSCTA